MHDNWINTIIKWNEERKKMRKKVRPKKKTRTFDTAEKSFEQDAIREEDSSDD